MIIMVHMLFSACDAKICALMPTKCCVPLDNNLHPLTHLSRLQGARGTSLSHVEGFEGDLPFGLYGPCFSKLKCGVNSRVKSVFYHLKSQTEQ